MVRWLLASLAVLGACTKDGGDPPVKPGPPPPHVAAVVSLPTLRASIDGLGALLDATDPGTSIGLAAAAPGELAQLAGAASLDGHDAARPLYVVVLDPPGGDPQVVIIA